MSDLTSKFTREDIETLIEATGDWETLGNHEFHVMSMFKGAPMPPEDHEAFEVMQQIKDHFRKREKEILASRAVRQEKAVFLKAKLMMARKDLGISQLFDLAAATDANSPMPVKEVPKSEEDAEAPVAKAPKAPANAAQKLADAEFFIKDLGVWGHYEKFLKERAGETV
jgi:hypothetical protein